MQFFTQQMKCHEAILNLLLPGRLHTKSYYVILYSFFLNNYTDCLHSYNITIYMFLKHRFSNLL